jgi:hypothetical protein
MKYKYTCGETAVFLTSKHGVHYQCASSLSYLRLVTMKLCSINPTQRKITKPIKFIARFEASYTQSSLGISRERKEMRII